MLLLDGPAIAYRSHFALAKANLTTARGKSTAATYGFVTTLLKLLKEESPSYACVAFDTDKPTYRHHLFEGYKADRPGMPDDLASQLDWIKEITRGLGIRVLEMEGYEADDIIATLARMAERAGIDTVIATGDKDMLQLVDERTRVIMLSGWGRDTKLFDEQAVMAKYGISPTRLVDFFGLTGDAIDCVPGVPGIGEKTAKELVARYGTLEGIYQNLTEITAVRPRKALEENRERAFSSRELVTVHQEVPLDLGLEDMARSEVDRKTVKSMFAKLNFRTLLGQIGDEQADPAEPAELPRIWSGSAGGVERAAPSGGSGEMLSLGLEQAAAEPPGPGSCETLTCVGHVGIDVNLGDGPLARAPVLGVAIACSEGGDHYLPLAHGEPGNMTGADFASVAGGLLASGETSKVVHDAKRLLLAARNLGVEVRGIEFDTLLARYLLNPGQGGLDIDSIALDYLGNAEGIETQARRPTGPVTVKEAAIHFARRARTALAVRRLMEDDLKSKGLWDLFRDVELPLAEVLAEMECRGVRVDSRHLERLREDLDARLSRAQKEAYALAGRPFNLNSPRDIGKLLFEEIGLKPKRKTKTGYSTDLSVLIELSAEHELPGKILDFRQTAKLKSTYVDQLLRSLDPGTQRIHASFNQTVTATGRLSSSDPNLQNIPIKDDLGAEIRKAFVPSGEDWLMISGDYSQVELRVVAHLSGDERLVDAFTRGEDIHTSTAANVFKVADKDVTPTMRGIAKVVNFGIIYGMGVQSLAKTTGLSLEEATRFVEEHRKAYPGLYVYLEKSLEGFRERGYVETVLGRKRFLPDVRAAEPAVRAATERAAVNMPVQGSAADIIKIAMLGVHREIKRKGLQGGILIQVHDEILVECPICEKTAIEAILYNEMTNAYSLAVPLKVDLRSGRNWYEAH